jgi:hypothetical protein
VKQIKILSHKHRRKFEIANATKMINPIVEVTYEGPQSASREHDIHTMLSTCGHMNSFRKLRTQGSLEH